MIQRRCIDSGSAQIQRPGHRTDCRGVNRLPAVIGLQPDQIVQVIARSLGLGLAGIHVAFPVGQGPAAILELDGVPFRVGEDPVVGRVKRNGLSRRVDAGEVLVHVLLIRAGVQRVSIVRNGLVGHAAVHDIRRSRNHSAAHKKQQRKHHACDSCEFPFSHLCFLLKILSGHRYGRPRAAAASPSTIPACGPPACPGKWGGRRACLRLRRAENSAPAPLFLQTRRTSALNTTISYHKTFNLSRKTVTKNFRRHSVFCQDRGCKTR